MESVIVAGETVPGLGLNIVRYNQVKKTKRQAGFFCNIFLLPNFIIYPKRNCMQIDGSNRSTIADTFSQGASSEVPAYGRVMVKSPNANPTRLMDAFWLDWNNTKVQ